MSTPVWEVNFGCTEIVKRNESWSAVGIGSRSAGGIAVDEAESGHGTRASRFWMREDSDRIARASTGCFTPEKKVNKKNRAKSEELR